ncbi:MAG: CDP-alcohol phosphatidyltransferase family protein [Planctomycetota bacterium]
MWNLANALTLSRFVTAPVFLALVLSMERGAVAVDLAALGILIVTLLSDLFDGYLARNQRTVTRFGKIMDPVADSTFFLTALFAFAASPRFQAPIWMPLVVLYREIGMQVLRRYAALSGEVLPASLSGKVKMFVQSVILLGILAGILLRDAAWLTISPEALRRGVAWAIGLIVAVNLLSLIQYLFEIPRLRRALRDKGA